MTVLTRDEVNASGMWRKGRRRTISRRTISRLKFSLVESVANSDVVFENVVHDGGNESRSIIAFVCDQRNL